MTLTAAERSARFARRFVVGLVFAFVGVVDGCSCGPGEGEPLQCSADSQCDPAGEGFLFCSVETGFCLCKDDRGCGAGETCNSLGRCQAESGCNSNADCRDGFFCDVTANQCLSQTDCGPVDDETCCVLDSQCGFNNVCDALRKKCVDGCRDDADCILGQACVRGLGQPIGQCAAGVCSGNNLCAFGEICNSDGECVKDTRGDYCLGCAGGVQSDDCGTPGNFCLTDSVNGGEFCGVDCRSGEACPFGYSCNEVIIIPPQAPFCNAEVCVIPEGENRGTCSTSGTGCTKDDECPIGFPSGDCPNELGNCKVDQLRSCANDSECPDGDECVFQECRLGEGDGFGYCSCTRDSDCPDDRCTDINPVTQTGRCELSGAVCFDDVDCESIIQCIDGGCFIGKNCAPQDGRTCRDLLPSNGVDLNP
jgi:hypothetical protein